MTSRIVLILITAIAMSFAMAAIYTWVDDAGTTHFSQSPPAQGARTVDIPETVPEVQRQDAQRRLQRLLEAQKKRDAARAHEKADRTAKRVAEKRRLWEADLTCSMAKRVRRIFGTARPVFRLNRRCERVYVTHADRKLVLDATGLLTPEICAHDYRGELSREARTALTQMGAMNERHMEQRGEPVEYPDFDDPDLTSLLDFCRCAPTFLQEMADPRHRTPRSTVRAARQHAEQLCPRGE